jgi:hypothetical protein
VVAKIRGADDVSADSLRTVQIMQIIAENAAKMAEDSIRTFAMDSEKNTTDSSMVQQSFQRDENTTSSLVETEQIRIVPIVPKITKVEKQLVTKPAAKPVNKVKQKPKAVMPVQKTNDY